MRRYLGSGITIFAAIVAPLFVLGPLLFAIIILTTADIGVETVFLSCFLLSCSIFWGIYLCKISNQLYSWGVFTEKDIRVLTAWKSQNVLYYDKFKSCGIAYYTHGILNSKVGSKVYFIYLSYDSFEEKYRSQINLWKPTKTRLKLQFDKKTFDYLVAVLPQKQAQRLAEDYKRIFVEVGKT